MPAIAVERVLLVHDAQAGVEHLVREIAFSNVHQTFGFVVPTPSKPGVFKVDGLRWDGLERKFPLQDPGDGAPGSGQGFGSGAGRLGGVSVLEAKRVGSFAAFVLAATDGKALRGWLDRNRLETTPASEAWLDHYVKQKFFFVALRFEPSLYAAKRDLTGRPSTAETLRISFATPVPFYPYKEPERDDLQADRAIALWLLTASKPRVPIALVREGEALSYVRPLHEGVRRPPASTAEIQAILGEKAWKELAPGGTEPLSVQVFEDQKRSRRGFGDILFVPEEPEELDDDAVEQRRALLPVLDPGLEAP